MEVLVYYSEVSLENKMTECNYIHGCNKMCSFIHQINTHTQLFLFCFSDFHNLLVTNESFIVHVVQQHQPAVIPCRPSSLDVKVTLWRDSTQVSVCASHLGGSRFELWPRQLL